MPHGTADECVVEILLILFYLIYRKNTIEFWCMAMKKTVLITGASGGIGSALAKKYIENGYFVVGTYYSNEQKIRKMQKEFQESFLGFPCDLSKFENAAQLMETLHQKNLSVDILINNAGISIVGVLQDLTADEWDNIWNTNVTSALSLSRSVIPDFLSKGSGEIINISSIWGKTGASCEAAYSTTKGALNSFTKALALELAPSNIRVNALACGLIDTKMNAHLSPDEISEFVSQIPAGRIGTPEDVANAAFLLSTAGSYITGQILTIDGGFTA